MNNKQIVEYCRKLILNNLRQHVDENPEIILTAILDLESDKTNKKLLEHCEGLKSLLERCIEFLEKGEKDE